MSRPSLRLPSPGPHLPGLLPALAAALLAAVLLAPATPASAANHTVEVRDSSFSPATLTIQVGDSVTWTNVGNLSHNVRADDLSFRCANGCDGDGGNGDPSSAAWSFTLTFDEAGDVPYHCQVHGGIGGVGMAGSITVEGQQAQPGNLRFTSTSFSAGEASGSRNVTVRRDGGTDGQVTVDFATGDGSATAGQDYEAASGTLTWADGEGGQKGFSVTLLDDAEIEGTETVNLTLSNPGGGAGLGSPSSATLSIGDDDEAPTGGGTLSFTDAQVTAGEDSGQAMVEVERSGTTAGTVGAQVTTTDGSAVAGEDYTAVSTGVTFGDGESGARPVAIPLVDDGLIEGNETFNVTLSDPSGGADLGNPGAATVTLLDDDLPAGPCVADDATLCLHEDRFQVRVEFVDPNAPGLGMQPATKIPLTERAGLFWFFNPANVEMLLKVQNACVDPFDRWWVFYAATTNVEFRITVVDTEEDVVRVYTNDQGTAALPIQDTDAFATCP